MPWQLNAMDRLRAEYGHELDRARESMGCGGRISAPSAAD